MSSFLSDRKLQESRYKLNNRIFYLQHKLHAFLSEEIQWKDSHVTIILNLLHNAEMLVLNIDHHITLTTLTKVMTVIQNIVPSDELLEDTFDELQNSLCMISRLNLTLCNSEPEPVEFICKRDPLPTPPICDPIPTKQSCVQSAATSHDRRNLVAIG